MFASGNEVFRRVHPEIQGLDENCTVGLGGTFYTIKERGQTIVASWLGEEVSREVHVRNKLITFTRKGRTFRGRLQGTKIASFLSAFNKSQENHT